MHTKIIERHPLALGRGILHRASSVAALALTPKTDRFFRKNIKKTVAKQGTLFCAKQHAKNWHAFLARAWRHCGTPYRKPKNASKIGGKKSMPNPRQNLTPKLPRKKLQKISPNATKNLRRHLQIPRRKPRGGRARRRYVNPSVESHMKLNLTSNMQLALDRHVDLDLNFKS